MGRALSLRYLGLEPPYLRYSNFMSKRINILAFLITLSFNPAYASDSSFFRINTKPEGRIDTIQITHQYNYALSIISSNPDSAENLLKHIVNVSKEIGFHRGVVCASDALGSIYCSRGDFNTSFQYYQAAIAVSKHHNFQIYLENLHNSMGIMLTYAGDYREAARYFYKTLELSETAQSNRIKSNVYRNLSSLWLYMNDSAKAVFYLNRAEKNARLEKDSFALGSILNLQGIRLLNTDSAAAYNTFKEAEAISEACEDQTTYMQVQSGLIYFSLAKRDTGTVYKLLALSETIFRKGNFTVYNQIEHICFVGSLYYTLKNYDRALFYLNTSYKLADSINSPWHKKKPISVLYKLYADMGNYEIAMALQQEYAAITEALNNDQRQKEIRWLDSKYQTAQLELEETRQKLRLAEQQSKMRQQQLLIFSGIGLLILLTVLYLMMRRNQKRRLRLQEQESRALQQEGELQRTKALIDGEERERKRVALELHDGIGSMLSIAKLNLSVVRDSYARGTLDVPHRFSEVLGLLDRSSQAIRSTAHALMPEILLQGGLNEALALYFAKLSGLKACQIRFTYYDEPALLEAEKERNIFRALQQVTEALIDNVQPKALWVQLNWQDTCLYATVEMESALIEGESDTGVLMKALQEMLTLADGIVYNDEESDTFDIEFSL